MNDRQTAGRSGRHRVRHLRTRSSTIAWTVPQSVLRPHGLREPSRDKLPPTQGPETLEARKSSAQRHQGTQNRILSISISSKIEKLIAHFRKKVFSQDY